MRSAGLSSSSLVLGRIALLHVGVEVNSRIQHLARHERWQRTNVIHIMYEVGAVTTTQPVIVHNRVYDLVQTIFQAIVVTTDKFLHVFWHGNRGIVWALFQRLISAVKFNHKVVPKNYANRFVAFAVNFESAELERRDAAHRTLRRYQRRTRESRECDKS